MQAIGGHAELQMSNPNANILKPGLPARSLTRSNNGSKLSKLDIYRGHSCNVVAKKGTPSHQIHITPVL
jgi:hypothetical protein